MGPKALFPRGFKHRLLPATHCDVEAAPRDYFSTAEWIYRGLMLMLGFAVLQLLGYRDNLPRQELVARLREVHIISVSDLL